MTNKVTIKTLASEIKSSVEDLVKKFSDIGISKIANDFVTMQEKQILLEKLKLERNSSFDKPMLKYKTRSVLNLPSNDGKKKSVTIEVRKKRVFIKPDLEAEMKDLTTKEHIRCKTVEEKIYHIKKVVYESTNEVLPEHEETKKSKFESKKKNKIDDHKNHEAVKNARLEKLLREKNAAELKRKVEEESRRKLEEEARRIASDTRRIAKKNENSWNKTSDSLEEIIDYHTTTSRYARQAEDDQNHEVEKNNRSRIRSRNSKIMRKKQNKKRLESKAYREEERDTVRSNRAGKRKSTFLQQSFQKPTQSLNRDILIGEKITVGELANKMAVKSSQVIKTMIKLGTMATINQIIDQKTAQLIAENMGHKVTLHHENALETIVMNDRDIIHDTAEIRPPIVTIMGHVDHGKTSLLDYIRSTKVTSLESGGITQHIGAYHVKTKHGMITFLDTPGHTAFTAMRLRGVQVTDIVVLVIAADDGVMPQTIEAIQHVKLAMVPVIVAINKIDKPEANIERVKRELSQYGIISDEWGGDCQFINISAKTGDGISALLDAILLQAEMLELKAIHKGMAKGVIIESFLDKGRGPVATVLVREGTMNKGDIVLCGFEYGRIRAMNNSLGEELVSVGPSIPVEVFGLSGVPEVGQEITVVRNEKQAREVALYRQDKFREVKLACQKVSNFEHMFSNNILVKEIHDMNIIVKADVQGSVEAISSALLKLSTEKIKIKIISSGVGGITETDAVFAAASNAMIIGFNVRADTVSRRIIEKENLDVRYYSIIYNLIDDIQLKINGLNSSKVTHQIVGLAEIRNIFKSKKYGVIAGCLVTKGIIKYHNPIRILRDSAVIYEGKIGSLKRFKDDVSQVYEGMECGISIQNYNDIHNGDIIEMFEII